MKLDTTKLLEEIYSGKNELLKWDPDYIKKMKKIISNPKNRRLCVHNLKELKLIAPFLESSDIKDAEDFPDKVCFVLGPEVDLVPAKLVEGEFSPDQPAVKWVQAHRGEATNIIPRKHLNRWMFK